MNLSIRTHQVSNNDGLIDRVRNLITKSFARFQDKIRTIQLSLSDTNGPRGGVDKRCVLRVDLIPRGVVVVTQDDSNLERAIRKGISRANMCIRKKKESTQYA